MGDNMGDNLKKIKEDVFKAIDELYNTYDLPPQNISDKEWNAFFYVIESHFLANNIIGELNNAVNVIIRHALYYAQTSNAEEFTVEHLKKALSDLSVYNIYSAQVSVMQDEINTFANRDEEYNYFK